MKPFYYFFLFLLFTKLPLTFCFAQDSIFVSFPNGIKTYLTLENSEVIPSGLQKKFSSVAVFKAKSKLFPKTVFRILKMEDLWELYMISGDSITKIKNNKDGFWEIETEDDFKVQLNCMAKSFQADKDLSKALQSFPDDTLRIYRLALSATGEFFDFHGRNQMKVFGVMVSMVNLINAVFERDLGIRFTLIERTDDLIFQYANADPFSLGNESTQNQELLDKLIGNEHYDIGHVLGGLKSVSFGKIGSICQTGQKGMGVSSSLLPDGIPFIFDYFSHELAHQLGANHTFNSIICNNQRNALTAWEPGSGISIMGYPGLCATDNLSFHVLPHFHSGTVEEIGNHLMKNTVKTCGLKIPMERRVFGKVVLEDKQLPVNTPFILQPVMDDFGDWFSWESFDLGEALPLNAMKGNSPNISGNVLNQRGTRSFPGLDSLVNLSPEPGVLLANYERKMNLRLTRRDAFKMDWHTLTLQVNANAGPFLLTSPSADIVNTGEEPVIVEWNPAQTFLPPLNATMVDIFLVDILNPDTFIYLQKMVPNLGRFALYIPLSIPSSTYRLGVKGSNKLFFNLSQGKIFFQKNENTFLNPVFTEAPISCGNPITFHWDLSNLPIKYFPLTIKIQPIPGWNFPWKEKILNAPEKISWGVSHDKNIIPPIFNTTNIEVISEKKGYIFPIEWRFSPKNDPNIQALSPVEKSEVFDVKVLFSWKTDVKADWYQMEIAENDKFERILDTMTTTKNEVYSNLLFNPGRTYYWRVKYHRILCGSGYSATFSFNIGNAACTNMKTTDTLLLNQIPFRQSNLVINQMGIISSITDLWLSMKIADGEKVKLFLKAPSGKKIPLFLPVHCMHSSEWQYFLFKKTQNPSEPCVLSDTLVVPVNDVFTALAGERLNGLWQLLFEGVNQQGVIGDWGMRICSIDRISSIKETDEGAKMVSIFPNPGGNQSILFSFKVKNEANIYLWDMFGHKIGTWKKDGFEDLVQISGLEKPQGVYFWEILYDNKKGKY
jgi:hypothetical protein